MNTNAFDHLKGLTNKQVQERIQKGLVNGELNVTTKSYKKIISDNLFSLFNLINVILLVGIIISGSLKNALFFFIVIWNFLIGTIQEIRAKKTIEKLSILSAPKACVLREQEFFEIPVKDIVLGDVMKLNAGDQICADALILEGYCQVNESLITGESTPLVKTKGDHLLSGSFLISGSVFAETEHIGNDNYVNQITLGAKYFKKNDSVILSSVQSIVRIIVLCLIPLSALFVWNNFFHIDQTFSSAMVKTVAAISSMIPGGLVLLVSVVLAVSVVRLSQHNTLVQDLYCIEKLARVDILLLDKTGTITEGKMQVEDMFEISDLSCIESSLSFFIKYSKDENSTMNAIREYAAKNISANTELDPVPDLVMFLPFSSEKKWSLAAADSYSVILGAPEFVLGNAYSDYLQLTQPYIQNAKRVLVLAKSDCLPKQINNQEYDLPDNIYPLAFFALGDKIRKEAKDTFRYFVQEGVEIKVISGDAPETVSRISSEAGLQDADKWLDVSSLSDEEIEKAAGQYKVFGRVLPKQKEQIVKALQEQGHVVAMTGDGANDVLALRKADCSIAMQNGSDAARHAANMVLLDSNFSSLPLVVAEGRKSINNLQRSAALYLSKTIYSFIFMVLFIVTTKLFYPFENIQITLIGAITIGVPSFFLALEPNCEQIKKHFLWNVFKNALPSGILEAIGIIVFLMIAENTYLLEKELISSAAVYLMLMLGIITVFNLSGKINKWKFVLTLFLILCAFAASVIMPGLFSLYPLSWQIWQILLIIAAVYFICHFIIIKILLPAVEKN